MANKKINGITIAINSDTTGVTSGLKELTTESISLSKQLKSVQALLNMDPGNTEALAMQQDLLAKSIETTRKKLEALKAAQEDVKAAVARGDIGTDEYIAFQRELVQTENRLKELESTTTGTTDEVEDLGKETEKTGDEMQDADKKSGQFGETLKNVVSKGAEAAKVAIEATIAAIAAISTAVIKFAKESVETGMQFDAAVSQIGATLGYTVDEINDKTSDASKNMEMLRGKAEEMGAATSFSATEAAEGLNILAMSGYSAEEACSMINDVLALAEAGSLGLAEAAKYVAGAMKGFNDETKDSQYYADLMAKGATLAATDVNALGEAMSTGAATAASYSQSADSMTVSLLRLANQGTTGSEAATMLARAMADVYTATPVAQEALEKLNVSAFDDGKPREFGDVLEDINQALSGMSEEEALATKNAIFTTNGLKAFNQMMATSSEQVSAWTDALDNATGSAAAQSEMMNDNLTGDIKKFNSALDGAKIALSDSLTPALRDFVQYGGASVAKLTKAFKEGGLSGAIAELGPVLDGVIERINEVIPGVISVASEIITALAKQLPNLLKNMLPSLISGVSSVIKMLTQQFPAIFKVISDAMPVLINAFTSILPEVLKAGLLVITELARGIAESLPTMVPQIVEIITEIVDVLTDPATLGALVDASLAIVTALVTALLAPESIDKMIEKVPEVITNIVDILVDSVDKLLDAALEIVTALCGYFFDPKNLAKIEEAAGKVLTKLGEGMKKLQSNLLPFIIDVCTAWAEMFIGEIDYDATALDVIQRLGAAFVRNFTHSSFNLGMMAYDLLHGDGEPESEEHYAVGGLVTAPTRAIVGENGAEVILPLENNTHWMDVLASKIGGGGMTIGAINVEVTGIDGAREIGNEIVRRIDEAMRNYQINQDRGVGGSGWRT